MRDLILLASLLVLLPLAFSNAFIAYLVWGWTSVIAIDSYMFGFMQSARLNMIFALVALLMIALKRDNVRGSSLNQTGTILLLALFFVQTTVSVILAYDGNPNNFDLYDKLVKILIFVFVMPLVVVGRYRIHAMVVMICLGLGFHGLIDGLKFFASGGGHIVRGFIKFGDNNHFAVMLVLVIPLLLYLTRYANNKFLRMAALFAAFANIAAIIGTHSRGGLVTLLATGALLIIGTKQRVTGIIVMGCGVALMAALAPSSWTERMETIKAADADSSFMQRVEAWQVSSEIALNNPFTGGGLHAVQVRSVWERFSGNKGLIPFVEVGFVSTVPRAAHSIYFEVLGDTGFIGLFLFVAILINGMWNSRRIRTLVNGREHEFEWAIDLSNNLTATIFGFMVGGLLVSLAYSEVIWMIIILSEVLRREVANAIALKPLATPSQPAKI